MTSLNQTLGGTLPAPEWWPTRQPLPPKPHWMKVRGRWFMVYDRKVTWNSAGGSMTLRCR